MSGPRPPLSRSSAVLRFSSFRPSTSGLSANQASYGASARVGGHPADRPVRPADLGATLLRLLGVRPEAVLHDRAGRPFRASQGTPIAALSG